MFYQKVNMNGEEVFIPFDADSLYEKCPMCGNMVELDYEDIEEKLYGGARMVACCDCTAKLMANGMRLVPKTDSVRYEKDEPDFEETYDES